MSVLKSSWRFQIFSYVFHPVRSCISLDFCQTSAVSLNIFSKMREKGSSISFFKEIFHTIRIMHKFLKIVYDVEFQSQFGLLVISYVGLRIFMELPNIFVCSSIL